MYRCSLSRCRHAAVAFAIFVSAAPAAARTWVVRAGDSIQATIDLAGTGDVILLFPGTYREYLEIKGKRLTVRSLAGPETTVIELEQNEPRGDHGLVLDLGASGTSFHELTVTVAPSDWLMDAAIVFDGDLSMTGCIVRDMPHTALERTEEESDATVTIEDTSFIDCRLALQADGDITVRDCVFRRCHLGVYLTPRGPCSEGSALIDASHFEDCRTAIHLPLEELDVLNSSFVGCGAAVSAPTNQCLTATMRNCQILASRPHDSFQVAVQLRGAVLVEDCLFAGGQHGDARAILGVIGVDQPATVRRCRFEHNESNQRGAVLGCSGGPLDISDCTFSDNRGAWWHQVALTASADAPVRVADCDFLRAESLTVLSIEEAGPGSFIKNSTFADCSTSSLLDLSEAGGNCNVYDCAFTGNNAAGIVPFISAPGALIERSVFTRNVTSTTPGIHAESVRSCRFLGNASARGLIRGDRIIGCAFVGNAGSIQALGFPDHTIVGGTFAMNPDLSIGARTLVDCIVWQDDGPGPTLGLGQASYNLIAGTAMPGNINADPLFVREPSPGVDGAWGTVDDDYGDLRLRAGSLCIDAGDSGAYPEEIGTDLDGNPRFVDDAGTPDTGVPDPARSRAVVDMGAYEFQGGAAPPPPGPVCDFDADGQVDVHDLLGFIHDWVGGEAAADVNRDGAVNVTDLLEFVDCFLTAR